MSSGASVYCIFGGGGFVGSHLVETLAARNDVEVRILSRKSRCQMSAQVSYFVGDICEPESWLNFIVPGAKVINLAPLPSEAVNKVVSRCATAGAARLIHVSTATVVGKTDLARVDENTECRPETEYERKKFDVEQFFSSAPKGAMDFAILRPSAIFGRGGKNLVKTLRELRHRPIIVQSLKAIALSRRNLNLVPVESVVAAIIFLSELDRRLSGERFIISRDDAPENNFGDVSRILAASLGISFVSLQNVVPDAWVLAALKLLGRSQSNPRLVYSAEKLRQWGFKDSVDFREALIRFAKEPLSVDGVS